MSQKNEKNNMKYLKSKKVFEHYLKRFDESSSNESELFDHLIIDECEDILLEIEDKGFRTYIDSYYRNWIKFNITRKEEFTYSDIEDVVERLKSFLSQFGLYIKWQSSTERREKRPTIETRRVFDPYTFISQGVRTECQLLFKKDSYESKE